MVRIRLRRVGAKKQPHYRVVVADQRSPRDGRHIETIGYYNPRTEPETVNIKEERALYWLSQGARPSDVVRRMLERQGTLDRLTRLQDGEPIEALVAEYEAGAAAAEAVVPVEAAVEVEAPAADSDAPEGDVPEADVPEADVPEAEVPEAAKEAPEGEPEEAETEEEPDEAPADDE
jgi:small subunit ribosomal protein S16